ncbi:hypothetical protein POM88_041251 [Heracleum sosnowskyi]|uniref:Uncharacterized protein n=1 Tax=Heracleum sosnowskyi TaxID=360622 RepID=A0AAD8HDV1_9APIA|nr:hypothetical protein POM88_041251 [Heracleum sosnowskyi]
MCRSNLYTVVVHYSGSFVHIPSKTYTSTTSKLFKDVDLQNMSVNDVKNFLGDIIGEWDSLFYKNMNNGAMKLLSPELKSVMLELADGENRRYNNDDNDIFIEGNIDFNSGSENVLRDEDRDWSDEEFMKIRKNCREEILRINAYEKEANYENEGNGEDSDSLHSSEGYNYAFSSEESDEEVCYATPLLMIRRNPNWKLVEMQDEFKRVLKVDVCEAKCSRVRQKALSGVENKMKEHYEKVRRFVGEILHKDLELGDGFRKTLISDQQKGLDKAIRELLPQVEHRFCTRHLNSNLSKVYPSSLPKQKRQRKNKKQGSDDPEKEVTDEIQRQGMEKSIGEDDLMNEATREVEEQTQGLDEVEHSIQIEQQIQTEPNKRMRFMPTPSLRQHRGTGCTPPASTPPASNTRSRKMTPRKKGNTQSKSVKAFSPPRHKK